MCHTSKLIYFKKFKKRFHLVTRYTYIWFTSKVQLMKKTFGFLWLFISSFVLLAGEKEKYTINNEVSKIEWVGKKVTGSHEGIISIQSGTIVVEEGQLLSATINIDMTSIVITDIEDKGSNQKLMDVFTSPSFFNTTQYSTASLVIEEVHSTTANQCVLKGNITIKDVQKPISISATTKIENNKIVVIGETEIDRTDFDIKYGSGSFFDTLGDKAIKDLFLIKFKIGALK